MKKLAVLCIAAIGAALVVFGTAPSASAYPELTCSVSVDRQVVNPGDTFTATGKNAASAASRWTFRWNGVTEQRSGAVASASFTAPEVASSRTITLTAKSASPAGDCIRHVDITVNDAQVAGPSSGGAQPASTGAGGPHSQAGAGGLLPNTGGPRFWVLLGGLALLLAGAASVVAARRRS